MLMQAIGIYDPNSITSRFTWIFKAFCVSISSYIIMYIFRSSSIHLPSSSTFHLCIIFLPNSAAMRSISNRCRSPHLRQRLRRPRRWLPRQRPRGAGRAGRAVGLSPKPQGAPVGWPRVVDFHREMVVDLFYLMNLV